MDRRARCADLLVLEDVVSTLLRETTTEPGRRALFLTRLALRRERRALARARPLPDRPTRRPTYDGD